MLRLRAQLQPRRLLITPGKWTVALTVRCWPSKGCHERRQIGSAMSMTASGLAASTHDRTVSTQSGLSTAQDDRRKAGAGLAVRVRQPLADQKGGPGAPRLPDGKPPPCRQRSSTSGISRSNECGRVEDRSERSYFFTTITRSIALPIAR